MTLFIVNVTCGNFTYCDNIFFSILEPLSVQLDLQIVIDDVPIGLSLQSLSPFKYECNKLWLKPIPEIGLPFDNISKLVNINVSVNKV